MSNLSNYIVNDTGLTLERWLGIMGICNACPYNCEACIEDDDCDMIAAWLKEGRISPKQE